MDRAGLTHRPVNVHRHTDTHHLFKSRCTAVLELNVFVQVCVHCRPHGNFYFFGKGQNGKRLSLSRFVRWGERAKEIVSIHLEEERV
jgi:hypothetical protein